MAKSVLKKAKDQGGVVLNNRYKWVEFTTEDDQIIRAKVRTSLLNVEVEKLVGLNMNTDQQREIWEAIYPYVEDWNVRIVVNEGGEDIYYDVLPPKEGGPESFDYAPRQLTMAIIGTLINEPFTKVDPKSLTPVETTDEP